MHYQLEFFKKRSYISKEEIKEQKQGKLILPDTKAYLKP